LIPTSTFSPSPIGMFEPLYTDIRRNNRHAEKTSPCEKGTIDHPRGAQIGYPLARNGKRVALRDCAAQRLNDRNEKRRRL
jgi:hypothetical protein